MKNKYNIRGKKTPDEIELERQPHMLRVPGVTELNLTPDIESISHIQYGEDKKEE